MIILFHIDNSHFLNQTSHNRFFHDWSSIWILQLCSPFILNYNCQWFFYMAHFIWSLFRWECHLIWSVVHTIYGRDVVPSVVCALMGSEQFAFKQLFFLQMGDVLISSSYNELQVLGNISSGLCSIGTHPTLQTQTYNRVQTSGYHVLD